jgi:hypothetical protein
MIYVFSGGSVVYDGSTITNEQKKNAVAVENLPVAENRDGFYSQIRANIEKQELYFEYLEEIENVDILE